MILLLLLAIPYVIFSGFINRLMLGIGIICSLVVVVGGIILATWPISLPILGVLAFGYYGSHNKAVTAR